MSQEEKVGDVSGGKDSRPIDTYKFSILSDTPAIFVCEHHLMVICHVRIIRLTLIDVRRT